MSVLRNYATGTRAALVALSRGTCYWPQCDVRVIKRVVDDYSFNLHIAHIQGAQEKGARHDPAMTPAQRKAFANLILLCKGHHEYVDITHPLEFPAEVLLQWKSDREVEGEDTLAGLTQLTEDNLRDLLVEVMEVKHDEIMETLARLEVNDIEAAQLMRGLLDELDQFRQYGPFLDIDAAASLHHASSKLAAMTDTAEVLMTAAELLPGLPDTVEVFRQAVDRLGGMEGNWQ